MRPVKGGQWPRSILCCDVMGKFYTIKTNGIAKTESLVSWSAALMTKQGVDYAIWQMACGGSAIGFWQMLHRVAEEISPTWIMSHSACRAWNLLSLWEEIENGRIIMAERPNMQACYDGILSRMRRYDSPSSKWPISAGSVSRLLGNAHGYMVSGDPPNILRSRFSGQKDWWQWVDIQNYGITRPDGIADGKSTVEWLCAATRSMSVALHNYHLGSLRPTAGSQALHGFRRTYYKGGIYVGSRREALEAESAGYYGGRCECCRIGASGCVVIAGDFASQYCRLCRDHAVPVRCTACKLASGGETHSPLDSESGIIGRVDIETEEPAYPYRRVVCGNGDSDTQARDRSAVSAAVDTDIIYPIGRFTTTLCGPELKDAAEHGRIKRWHSWCEYKMQPALSGYATAILSMRADAERTGDTVTTQLSKRLGNSLPGKFGERRKDWTYSPQSSCDIDYGEWYSPDSNGNMCRYRAIAGVVHRESAREWAEEAVPAISAWITSLGRMALLRAIRCAGWENVYYYDTDSIFTNQIGWDNLCRRGMVAVNGGEGLRHIGTDENPQFIGIKNYKFAGKMVCAGMPNTGGVAIGSGWTYQRSPTPTEMARVGERPRQQTVLVTVDFSKKYRHGVVDVYGIVSPIRLAEW
jgi:hypothetical protein